MINDVGGSSLVRLLEKCLLSHFNSIDVTKHWNTNIVFLSFLTDWKKICFPRAAAAATRATDLSCRCYFVRSFVLERRLGIDDYTRRRTVISFLACYACLVLIVDFQFSAFFDKYMFGIIICQSDHIFFDECFRCPLLVSLPPFLPL